MNLIQMITLYQMGSPAESVPPLKLLRPADVRHFDNGPIYGGDEALRSNLRGLEAVWRDELLEW